MEGRSSCLTWRKPFTRSRGLERTAANRLRHSLKRRRSSISQLLNYWAAVLPALGGFIHESHTQCWCIASLLAPWTVKIHFLFTTFWRQRQRRENKINHSIVACRLTASKSCQRRHFSFATATVSPPRYIYFCILLSWHNFVTSNDTINGDCVGYPRFIPFFFKEMNLKRKRLLRW